MSIISNAAKQAVANTILYKASMTNIATMGAKLTGAYAESIGNVAKDAAEQGAKSLKDAAKGAINTEIDRASRAVVRGDQFVKGATLATKAEARYVGQQVKGAAEDAAAFIRKDIAATKADFKGAAANAFDRFDRSITRADQFATGAALAGKTAINQGIQHVEIQSALAVHGFKQQGRRVGGLLESAHLTVRGEIAQGKQSLGEGLIKLGQKIAD